MTIGFIGAGNMARAIITGLLAKNAVTPEEIVLHGGQPIHYEPYAAKIGAKAVASNQAVADTADYRFPSCCPQTWCADSKDNRANAQTTAGTDCFDADRCFTGDP